MHLSELLRPSSLLGAAINADLPRGRRDGGEITGVPTERRAMASVSSHGGGTAANASAVGGASLSSLARVASDYIHAPGAKRVLFSTGAERVLYAHHMFYRKNL